MIIPATGNILQCAAECLVNPVNCVGVMGRGLALHFKHAFPANFHAYMRACRQRHIQPGRVFVFETGCAHHPRLIANFPTKRHWREQSRMEDITAGLAHLVEIIHHYQIHSIAIPALGCGLGGLNWNEVRPCIIQTLASLSDVQVLLFEPYPTPPLIAPHNTHNHDPQRY